MMSLIYAFLPTTRFLPPSLPPRTTCSFYHTPTPTPTRRSAGSPASLQRRWGVVNAQPDAAPAGSSAQTPPHNNPSQIWDKNLKVGSPIVIVEAPPLLKTAEPMPMMRPNTGLIKPGDAGRIIDRRPKDVWAVRFAVGAYLIDRKYFKLLDAR